MNNEIEKIIKEKFKLLDGQNIFLDAIESAEKKILKGVLDILQGLAQKEGRLRRDKLNNSLVKRLSVGILKVIRSSTLEKHVDKFLVDFEKVEKLNSKLYKEILGKDLTKGIKAEIGVLQSLQIEKILDGVLGEGQLKANIVNPIRSILFNGIAQRAKASDIEKEIRKFIKSDENKNSEIKRYIGQIVRDGLNQADGATQDLIRDAYQLDGLMYVGGLVDASRETCIGLIRGSGAYKELAIEAGLYAVASIPEIIRLSKNNKGWIESTTPENFGRNRGGNNCLHQVIYLPLSEEQKNKV